MRDGHVGAGIEWPRLHAAGVALHLNPPLNRGFHHLRRVYDLTGAVQRVETASVYGLDATPRSIADRRRGMTSKPRTNAARGSSWNRPLARRNAITYVVCRCNRVISKRSIGSQRETLPIYNLAPLRRTESRVNLVVDETPQLRIVMINSARRISMTRSTPSCPKEAKPHT